MRLRFGLLVIIRRRSKQILSRDLTPQVTNYRIRPGGGVTVRQGLIETFARVSVPLRVPITEMSDQDHVQRLAISPALEVEISTGIDCCLAMREGQMHKTAIMNSLGIGWVQSKRGIIIFEGTFRLTYVTV